MDSVINETHTKSALPSALLKRLAKRGIIEKQKAKSLIENAEKREKLDREEIIAENYDEEEEGPSFDYEYVRKPEENLWKEKMKTRMTEGGYAGYKCCPNKYNIFHKCTVFCMENWSESNNEPSDEYLKRKKRLLKRYPLPQGWVEVFDSGCSSFYYWNQEDDTVSWLPPLHPKSHISKSAGILRRELEESIPIDMDDSLPPPPGAEDENIPTANNFNQNLESSSKLKNDKLSGIPRKPKSRDLDKTLRSKRERKMRREESTKLDPMDPAAYSDIPRGTWSSGLINEDRQTGVDATVSGTLFQMRPYPSPGAVLKANKKANKVECDDNEDYEEDL